MFLHQNNISAVYVILRSLALVINIITVNWFLNNYYGGQGCPAQWLFGWKRGSTTAGYYRILIVTEEVLDQFYI